MHAIIIVVSQRNTNLKNMVNNSYDWDDNNGKAKEKCIINIYYEFNTYK